MREILFRGKTLSYQSEWAEGFYNHIPCGRFQCDEHCIQTIDEDGRIGQLYNVYESTVGQYTGLTDKNGKKIFDGDILKITWSVQGREPVSEKCVVVYSKGGFFMEHDSRLCGQVSNYACSCGGVTVEIIGNIHDNPELLED